MVVNRIRLLLLMVALLSGLLYGQAVQVTSSLDSRKVAQSGQVQLTLKIVSSKYLGIKAPPAPSAPGLIYRNVLSSSSSDVSIVNGQLSTESTQSFTYVYNPTKPGKYVIPGFFLRIGKSAFTTKAVEVEITSDPTGGKSQANNSPFVSPREYDYSGTYRGTGESWVVCQPQTQTVYKGQPAIVSYYLVTNQWVGSYNLESEQDYEGYGKSVYEQPSTLNYENFTQNGKSYRTALIKRIVLYPQVTGRLRVPTLTGTMRLLDYGYLNKSVSSAAAHVDVLPLPAGAPASFTGAIGTFHVTQSYSANQANLGEAITCSIKITGKGNFSQFTAPLFPAQESFQISEPMIQDQLGTGIEGTRMIYYTILPQRTGEFAISPFQFSWFDSAAGRYRSFRGGNLRLKVKPANVLSYFSGILSKSKPQALSPQLEVGSYPRFKFMAGRFWYWLALAAMLVSLLVSGFLAYDRGLKRRDPAAHAQKSASRVLDRYLQQASEAAKASSPKFYPLAEHGLLDYLGRNYDISLGLPTAELIEELEAKGVPGYLLSQLDEFFSLCQKARYMPGGTDREEIADNHEKLKKLVQGFVRLNSKFANNRIVKGIAKRTAARSNPGEEL